MQEPRQPRLIRRTAALALVIALAASPAAHAATTQTKTLLTGGEVHYQGSATADQTHADRLGAGRRPCRLRVGASGG